MDKYWIITFIIFILAAIFLTHSKVKKLNKKLYKLQSQLSNTQTQFNTLSKNYDGLTQNYNHMKAAIQEKEDFSEKMRLYKQENQTYILENIEKIYFVKTSLMNQQEQKTFYFLNCNIYGNYSRTYCVFPQVRVSDFIGIYKQTEEYKHSDNVKLRVLFDSALRNLTSKSVDFLICKYKEIESNNRKKYFYVPYLVIELDGSCHNEIWNGETQDDLNRRQENDAFKNTLFEKLNLKFERIQSNNAKTIEKERIAQIVRKYSLF